MVGANQWARAGCCRLSVLCTEHGRAGHEHRDCDRERSRDLRAADLPASADVGSSLRRLDYAVYLNRADLSAELCSEYLGLDRRASAYSLCAAPDLGTGLCRLDYAVCRPCAGCARRVGRWPLGMGSAASANLAYAASNLGAGVGRLGRALHPDRAGRASGVWRISPDMGGRAGGRTVGVVQRVGRQRGCMDTRRDRQLSGRMARYAWQLPRLDCGRGRTNPCPARRLGDCVCPVDLAHDTAVYWGACGLGRRAPRLHCRDRRGYRHEGCRLGYIIPGLDCSECTTGATRPTRNHSCIYSHLHWRGGGRHCAQRRRVGPCVPRVDKGRCIKNPWRAGGHIGGDRGLDFWRCW